MNVNIVVLIVSFSVVAGCVIYALINRKKHLLNIMNKIRNRLIEAGIETSVTIEKDDYLDKLGDTIKNIDRDIDGVCDVKGQAFDFVWYWAHASSNASTSQEYFHYIVINNTYEADEASQEKRSWFDNIFYERVTELSVKKGMPLWGKVTGVSWKGDANLAQQLNTDVGLLEEITQLLKMRKKPKKILIYWENRYAGIRTPIYDLSVKDFEIMNMIARHIRAAWFGG